MLARIEATLSPRGIFLGLLLGSCWCFARKYLRHQTWRRDDDLDPLHDQIPWWSLWRVPSISIGWWRGIYQTYRGAHEICLDMSNRTKELTRIEECTIDHWVDCYPEVIEPTPSGCEVDLTRHPCATFGHTAFFSGDMTMIRIANQKICLLGST